MEINQPFEPMTGKKAEKPAKMIAITSGKGGVGKSNFILNLAIAMSIRNKRVLLIDADMNLGNLDILLGIYPERTVINLLDDAIDVHELLQEGPKGVKIVTAASGDLRVLQNASRLQKALIQAVQELRPEFDYVLIDTGAGISEYTMEFVYEADKVIVITTPEPTAITDAYALIKMLFFQRRNPDITLMINMVQTDEEGKTIYQKISQILAHFLNKQVPFLGSVLTDKDLVEAVKDQTPVILKHPRSTSSAAIHAMAVSLIREDMKS
jgi:flagellar biosynthesis protein FlhG